MFREVFRREGVPLDLVYVAHIESLFRPRALSRARAKGLWQFIPGTGRLYGLRQDWWIDERSDILKSTVAAARFLKHLYGEFGDWYLALAGYNCGPRRIERILRRYGPIDYWEMVRRRLLPRETRNYVPSYLASTIIFKNPTRYGFQVEPDPELKFELVPLKEQVDLETMAELIEVPARLLDDLNPELRRRVTPFELPGYRMKVPLGTGDLAQKKLAQLPPEKRIKLLHHRGAQGRDPVPDRPPLRRLDSGHRPVQSAPEHPSAPYRTGTGHSTLSFKGRRRGPPRGHRRSVVPTLRARTSSVGETPSPPSPAPMG